MRIGRGILGMVAFGLIAACLTSCPMASLDLLWDQSSLDPSFFLSSTSAVDGYQETADDFTLAPGRSTIARIEWWGKETVDAVANETFVVRLFADNGSGNPKTVPLYAIPVGDGSRESTGQTAGDGNPIYHYQVDFTPFSLEPGKAYYLSILSSTRKWGWMEHGSPGADELLFYRTTADGGWGTAQHETAFRLWQPQ